METRTYQALVQYLDRKEQKLRKVWLKVEAKSLEEARQVAKASFTTFEVIEE